MDLLIQLFAFIITILVLVSLHEAGHFLVAKLLGVKVIRYAIGFGKPLYIYHSASGTDYVIGLIPLGGYVKLLDEREMPVPKSDLNQAFNRQQLWARALIVLAGPLTNILFAILGFWLMYVIGVETLRPVIGNVLPHSIAAQAGLKSGDTIDRIDGHPTPSLQKVVVALVERLGEKTTMSFQTTNPQSHETSQHQLDLRAWTINGLNPDPLKSLGLVPLRPHLPAIIRQVEPDSPAELAGLKPNDKVVSMAGSTIKDWYQLLEYIQEHPQQKTLISYERQGQVHTTTVTITKKPALDFRSIGYLGIKTQPVDIPMRMKILRQYPPIEALKIATLDTKQYLVFNFIIIKKLLFGQISLSSLGGPIAIFQTADLAFRQGVSIFFGFLALISVMLAFINLLPIPGLDGGHLFNYLIELIIRKPVPLKYELMSIRIGFFLLLSLMLIATLNDILRLFS